MKIWDGDFQSFLYEDVVPNQPEVGLLHIFEPKSGDYIENKMTGTKFLLDTEDKKRQWSEFKEYIKQKRDTH
jgi:hypothetical protein